MYLLGYDIGTSSVKAALVDAQTGQTIASAQYPDSEAPMNYTSRIAFSVN